MEKYVKILFSSSKIGLDSITVIYPGEKRILLAEKIEAVGLMDFLTAESA